MAVEHFWLKNEDASASFLCGAVSVICEYFNADLLDNNIDVYVASDVFYLGDNNEIPFDKAMQSRFLSYMQNIYVDDPNGYKNKINSFTLELPKKQDRLDKILFPIFADHGVSESDIANFCASVCHFFSQPLAVYSIADEKLLQNGLIKEYYAKSALGIIFVEFSNYLLVLVIGSEK